MRKYNIFFMAMISCSMLVAQEFESGHFIDNENNKVECFIQNLHWNDSPETIAYKLNENSEVLELKPESCLEFSIGKEIRYKSIDTDIPLTKANTTDKNNSLKPLKVRKELFALVLLQGKASLYRVTNAGENVFLINTPSGEIEALLYKEYIDDNFKIRSNDLFKRQLLKEYPCQNDNSIQSLRYNTKSMLAYFKDLNRCLGEANYIIYNSEKRHGLFSSIGLKVWGGVAQNRYEARNTRAGEVFDFDNEISLQGGLELEAFIGQPTTKKASLFFGIHYANASNELNLPANEVSRTILNLDVDIVALKLGFRHYLGLGGKSDIFFDGSVIANFYVNPTLTRTTFFEGEVINREPETVEFAPITRSADIVPAIGVGYTFDKRFYLRYALLLNQNLIERGTLDKDDFSQMTLSLGYTFW